MSCPGCQSPEKMPCVVGCQCISCMGIAHAAESDRLLREVLKEENYLQAVAAPGVDLQMKIRAHLGLDPGGSVSRTFDPTKAFFLQVDIRPEDWTAGRRARGDANPEDGIPGGEPNPSFSVCHQCALGQALNRTFREQFPDSPVDVWCAEGAIQVDSLGGDPLCGVDDVPADAGLVVHLFDDSRFKTGRTQEVYPTLYLKFDPYDPEI